MTEKYIQLQINSNIYSVECVYIHTQSGLFKITPNHDSILGNGTLVHQGIKYNGYFSYKKPVLIFIESMQDL